MPIARACHANACLSLLQCSKGLDNLLGSADTEHKHAKNTAIWHANRSAAWDPAWHRARLRQSQAYLASGMNAEALKAADQALLLQLDDRYAMAAKQAALSALSGAQSSCAMTVDRVARASASAIEGGGGGEGGEGGTSTDEMAVPASGEAWREEGNRLLRSGDPAAAVAAYDRSLAIEPADSRTHSNRCLALLQRAAVFLREQRTLEGQI